MKKSSRPLDLWVLSSDRGVRWFMDWGFIDVVTEGTGLVNTSSLGHLGRWHRMRTAEADGIWKGSEQWFEGEENWA